MLADPTLSNAIAGKILKWLESNGCRNQLRVQWWLESLLILSERSPFTTGVMMTNTENPTAMILGATGLIGNHLLRLLLASQSLVE